MGPILIIHRDTEISDWLTSDHSVVRTCEAEDLPSVIGAERFDTAILTRDDLPGSVLKSLSDADPDLAAIVIGGSSMSTGPNAANAWEIVRRPTNAETLRTAVRRAARHTQMARQLRNLRSQLNGDGPGRAPTARTDGAAAQLEWITTLPPRFDLRQLLSSVEKNVILRMLEATGGAQAEAARRLGLSRSDLSYKLAKYELRKPASAKTE